MSDKLLKEIKKQLKILIESKDITKAIEALLNSGSYRGVDYCTVDFDNEMDRVVVNIFYNKQFVFDNPRTISAIQISTNMEISKDVKTYFPDEKILYYIHYS